MSTNQHSPCEHYKTCRQCPSAKLADQLRAQEDKQRERAEKAEAQVGVLVLDALKLAKHIVENLPLAEWNRPKDHSCAECVPGEALVIAGHRCAVHIAREIVAGRTMASVSDSQPYYFPMADAVRCEKCGGVARVELDVGRSGFGCGSGHEHTPECPTTKCAHGTPGSQDCATCEDEEQAEADEEEGDGY